MQKKPNNIKVKCFGTKKTHFLLHVQLQYGQVDGAVMSSSFGPALLTLLTGYREKEWLQSNPASKLLMHTVFPLISATTPIKF